MNAVRIRVARPEDYDAVAGVADEWWGRPIVAVLPRLFLDHFHESSRVVEDDRGLAAFLVAFRSPAQPDVAYIHAVGVRPDQRGTGVARRLYEDFFDRARSAGCREVHAITGPGNAGSVAFHRRLGFTVRGPVPDYNGPGQQMITFHRPLTDES